MLTYSSSLRVLQKKELCLTNVHVDRGVVMHDLAMKKQTEDEKRKHFEKEKKSELQVRLVFIQAQIYVIAGVKMEK